MSSSKLGDKLEELDLTADEIHRLTEAMKKKEFRDLLADYAREISDPENKVRIILKQSFLFHYSSISVCWYRRNDTKRRSK